MKDPKKLLVLYLKPTVRPTLKLASHQAFTVAFRSGNLRFNFYQCLPFLLFLFPLQWKRLEMHHLAIRITYLAIRMARFEVQVAAAPMPSTIRIR